ncbi:MAG: DUF86 domain-containing protein [Bacilli bacterium]|nr:DUF86 domain-containing protein [Bacilli bacterium]
MKDKITIQKIITYISDVLEYINEMGYEDFFNDKKTLSACAFNISQIGELVNDISDETKNIYPDIPWKSIKGMRNKIVHDYDNVDLSVLWNTIINDLPNLNTQLKNIIDDK